jgi:hypothetical protein
VCKEKGASVVEILRAKAPTKNILASKALAMVNPSKPSPLEVSRASYGTMRSSGS